MKLFFCQCDIQYILIMVWCLLMHMNLNHELCYFDLKETWSFVGKLSILWKNFYQVFVILKNLLVIWQNKYQVLTQTFSQMFGNFKQIPKHFFCIDVCTMSAVVYIIELLFRNFADKLFDKYFLLSSQGIVSKFFQED